jgi:hypothetical protein
MSTAPAHAYQLRYDFEEMPLLSEGGIETGQLTGAVNVAYWDDEGPQFLVTEIYLEGYKRPKVTDTLALADWRARYPLVEIKPSEHPELHKLLFNALERERFGMIEEEVQNKLDWMREAAE